MELAGNAARDTHRSRITPRHVFLAVANDQELNQVTFHLILYTFKQHLTRNPAVAQKKAKHR